MFLKNSLKILMKWMIYRTRSLRKNIGRLLSSQRVDTYHSNYKSTLNSNPISFSGGHIIYMSARDGYMLTATLYPNFFQLLSPTDKVQYGYLRVALNNKSQRNKRVEAFTDAINKIKEFCVRGDCDDWKRCLVCGLAWFGDDIAINTRQLRFIVLKCKSSINGSLLKTGYNYTVGRTETAKEIAHKFPILKDNMSEIRQWTIRRMTSVSSPAPEVTCTEVIDNVFQNFFDDNDIWEAQAEMNYIL